MSAPAPVKLRYRLLSGVAALATLAALAGAAWQGYQAVASQPFTRVVFAGDLDRLPHADLDALSQAVQAAERPSLAAVREAARRVPWVRDATVRRSFPGGVEITFETHAALAHWNEHQLVSVRGDIFEAPGAGTLPRLRGPDAAAPEMARVLPDVVKTLAPLGSAVTEVRLSPRGGWEAGLENGMAIALGRGEWRARAVRFAALWSTLAPEARATRYADLRYPNGFALRKTK